MSTFSKDLVAALESVLLQLNKTPFPHVDNPADCEKRASVTAILRVRPRYQPILAGGDSNDDTHNDYSIIEAKDEASKINAFFAQQWVQEGDPEVLFIKRASRQGDRWSGHIALPGGRRDPEDADDLAAAVRETREEIGLELKPSTSIRVGNLPERVVTTAWGKKGLMVLCPYIFLLTAPTSPELRLQPTEVAAVHWVPLRALLSSGQRTRELVDVSARFAGRGGRALAFILRLFMGKMMLSAVRLIPSESIFASSIPSFVPETGVEGIFTGLATGSFGVPMSTASAQPPLHLWGLTLGVIADLLDLLPPYNAVKLWKYPTFTAPDLRLLIYVLTRPLRLNNARDLSSGFWPNQTTVDTTTKAVAVSEAELGRLLNRSGVSIGGENVKRPGHAVGALLSGYYDRMNVAIGIFLAYRAVLGTTLCMWFLKKWHRTRLSRI